MDKHRDAVFGSMHFGRPYWNIFEAKESMKKLPGFVERDLDENFGIEVTYEGKGFTSGTNLVSLVRGMRVLNQLKKSFNRQTEFYPRFKEKQSKRLSQLDELEAEKIPEKEFYDFYVKFIREEYFESESAYFYQIYNNTYLQSLFKDYYKKITKNKNANSSVLVLMSGIKDIAHLRFNYCLWNVSRLIRGNKEAHRFWTETSSENLKNFWEQGQNNYFMQEVREILMQFGHHSTNELNISVPRYREEPCIVFDSLKNYINLNEKHNPVRLTEKQYREYILEKTKVLKQLSKFKRSSFEKKVEKMRSFLWWHEELRDLSIRFYYHVRRFTLVLANHFVNRGILDTTEDIFFMSIDDIVSCIEGKASTEEAKDLIKRNRLYYRSFRNFENPCEIGNCFKTGTYAQKNKVHILKGTPCSPGIISGRVKLISDIFDAGRLEKGDILITRYTDPGWTPKFGLINGIATEYGGLLSHAALISREYGIPAVMAVKDLTKLVYDGQEITINGNTGEITLHQGGVQNAANTAESRL